jgi:hypothetical protein
MIQGFSSHSLLLGRPIATLFHHAAEQKMVGLGARFLALKKEGRLKKCVVHRRWHPTFLTYEDTHLYNQSTSFQVHGEKAEKEGQQR